MKRNHNACYGGPPSAELQFASRDDLLAFCSWFSGLEENAPFHTIKMITSADPAVDE